MNRDGLITAVSRLVTLLLLFAVNVLIARELGPEAQGQYVLATTFSALVVQFGHFGLHSTNTYLAARDRVSAGSLLSNSLWISLVIGTTALCGVAIAGSCGWLSADRRATFWWSGASIGARLLFLLGGSVLAGLGRFKEYNALQVVAYLVILVAVLIVAMLGGSVCGYLGALVFGWSVSAALLLIVAQSKSSLPARFNLRLFTKGVHYSTKVYVGCVLSFLVVRVNVFLLESICGAREVGQFGVALQFTDAIIFLPSAQAYVLFPRLVCEETGRWPLMLRNLRFMSATMLTIGVGCWACFQPFVLQVFGAEYLPSVDIMIWMLPGIFCYGLISIISQYLASVGFPTALVAAWVAALATTICGDLWLIPNFGGRGAAMSLSASYAILLVLVFLLAWRIEARSAGTGECSMETASLSSAQSIRGA